MLLWAFTVRLDNTHVLFTSLPCSAIVSVSNCTQFRLVQPKLAPPDEPD
jgi:hypothetical protein